MRDGHSATTVRLSDYAPPAFLVDAVALTIDIVDDATTRVTSQLSMRRNPQAPVASSCWLDGEALLLESVAIDGMPLSTERFSHEEKGLRIDDVPASFELTTTVRIDPAENTALEGLYVSRGMYCTQCEAEGFRRITFYPDRPDVLARFTTTIHADRSRYPVLLSNGNPVDQGESGGRHWVTWEDPFPKPCYLFAMVAGDLACLEDTYVTGSGRKVVLRFYAEAHDLDKLDHAVDSLKRAMRWDEEVYGREYDLDIYMIVAVSHFNMGAMENKGLNIFNTSCVLAHPEVTTDAGYQRVEAVVAHEYFHNWSGNRVTCRDWFQLSLKEGFTVFRDQAFSADMNSAAVKRVEDVEMLRAVQFVEDAGPTAHPVRPSEYQKIDNFYTVTIYEKGAEVVRMQYNLLGPARFREATDLYFERFDGQAVTCDDFVDCMQEVSGLDLTDFRRWYSQAGTPRLTVTDHYADGVYTLNVQQQTPPTPGQPEKAPLVIPLALSLLGPDGEMLPCRDTGDTEDVLIVDQAQQSFRFNVAARPTPSLLRGASAPVHLDYPFEPEQLALILAHDSDGYCRWDAAQRLYAAAIDRLLAGASPEDEAQQLAEPLRRVLSGALADPAGSALLLSLPSERALMDRYRPLDPAALHDALAGLRGALARALTQPLLETLDAVDLSAPYSPSSAAAGGRALVAEVFHYLAAAGDAQAVSALPALFDGADNMTVRLMALRLMVRYALPGADDRLEKARERWAEEALALDQWFAVQAAVPGAAAPATVAALLQRPEFDWRVPNRVRAVLGTWANGNLSGFHTADGAGYSLYADVLARLDALNPQVASRLAGAAGLLPRLEPGRASLLRRALEQVRAGRCSANLDEVLGRILAD